MAFALKYSIDYPDVKDVNHRLEIYEEDYVGSEIEIDGAVFLVKSSQDDLLSPIQGVGLRVELEANASLTFSDLYSEYEKEIKVIYKRNSVIKFVGWINPEGWYEDFVNDKWRVSFDCVDGLSFLENLGYVTSSGYNYLAQQTALEVIVACLEKTGTQRDIRADVNIVYDGLTETLDILDNAIIDPIRYFKDDQYTVMSSKEVLESVLGMFTACITMRNGEWYIYRPEKLHESSTFSYFHYDYSGTAKPTPTGTEDLSFTLGSEIDAFYPHHAGANQSMRNEKSLGALRINYKYGIKRGLLSNVYLYGLGSVGSEWTRPYTSFTAIPASNQGLIMYAIPSIPTGNNRILYSDNMALALDDIVDVQLKFDSTVPYSAIPHTEYFRYKIILTGTSTTYYLTSSGSWSTSDTQLKQVTYWPNQTFEINWNLTIPADGDLTIEVYQPEFDVAVPLEFEYYLWYASVIAKQDQEDNIEGENHTFQRGTNPNSKIEEKEVFNGDNDSSIYVGSLFKADGTTLTDNWKRKGVTEAMPIIQLGGESILRFKQSTSRIFSGSVYGYFDPLSVVSIDGVTGTFLCTGYELDTASNLCRAEFQQIFSDELTDIEYDKTVDYGTTVKPTIGLAGVIPPAADTTPPATGAITALVEL